MKIKQYDRVLMQDGSKASIVEIFEDEKSFIVDIERNGEHVDGPCTGLSCTHDQGMEQDC